MRPSRSAYLSGRVVALGLAAAPGSCNTANLPYASQPNFGLTQPLASLRLPNVPGYAPAQSQQPGYQQPGYQQPGYQPPQYPQSQYQQPQYQQPQYQQPQAAQQPPQQQSAQGAAAEQAFRQNLMTHSMGFGGIFGPGLKKWADTPSRPEASSDQCGSNYSEYSAQQACKSGDGWAADRLQNKESDGAEKDWYNR